MKEYMTTEENNMKGRIEYLGELLNRAYLELSHAEMYASRPSMRELIEELHEEHSREKR